MRISGEIELEMKMFITRGEYNLYSGQNENDVTEMIRTCEKRCTNIPNEEIRGLTRDVVEK